MKIWNEKENDVFSYFQWFNKDEAYERVGKTINMSVFSVNGSELFGAGDKSAFIELCNGEIKKVFEKQDFINNYKLYLFANVEVKDSNSRIEKYMKVWKVLQSKWQLEGFIKGREVEMEFEEKTFFSSVAEFTFENLPTALEIVSSNPKRFTIIASKKNDVLSERGITDIFRTAFNKYKNYADEIDYFNLSVNLCLEDDMVFRWGDSSEEAEIAIIFKSNVLTAFDS